MDLSEGARVRDGLDAAVAGPETDRGPDSLKGALTVEAFHERRVPDRKVTIVPVSTETMVKS
jgi:hypothetical protein